MFLHSERMKFFSKNVYMELNKLVLSVLKCYNRHELESWKSDV